MRNKAKNYKLNMQAVSAGHPSVYQLLNTNNKLNFYMKINSQIASSSHMQHLHSVHAVFENCIKDERSAGDKAKMERIRSGMFRPIV